MATKNPNNREELPREAKLLLIGVARATRFSLAAHVSVEAIRAKLPREVKINPQIYKRIKRKMYKKLLRRGLIVTHKTGRNVTYNISQRGLNLAKQYIEELVEENFPK